MMTIELVINAGMMTATAFLIGASVITTKRARALEMQTALFKDYAEKSVKSLTAMEEEYNKHVKSMHANQKAASKIVYGLDTLQNRQNAVTLRWEKELQEAQEERLDLALKQAEEIQRWEENRTRWEVATPLPTTAARKSKRSKKRV